MKTYDKSVPHAFSNRARPVTIGQLKAARLAAKNLRRSLNNLPPKAAYREI